MNGDEDVDKVFLLGLTRDIVSAYIANNALNADDLPRVIERVFTALVNAPHVPSETDTLSGLQPAVPISESITDAHIICLEDGLPFKSLKRHLRSKYGLTPEAYREKWQLPPDYPMVAPNYAKARSRIAKNTGLGRK